MIVHNKTRALREADYEEAVRAASDALAWAVVQAARAGSPDRAAWSLMHNTAELILREMNG